MTLFNNPDGKKLNDWHDLKEYGIEVLTGESCAIGQRLLCEISPEGVTLLEEFLSVKLDDKNNSWNHSLELGWKSIMLTHGTLTDLMVYVIARDYKYTAYVHYRGSWGYATYVEGFNDEEAFSLFRESANRIYRVNEGTVEEPKWRTQWSLYVNRKVGSTPRNQHHFSGRTV